MFRLLFPTLGNMAGAVTLIPTLVAAMLLRTWPTVAIGLISGVLINIVTRVSFGMAWPAEVVVTGLTSVVGIGVMVARLRELQDRVHAAERQRTIAEARARLSTAERLVSLGTLAAGIAHEVNNPLSFILANLRYAKETIASDSFVAERAEVLQALSESQAGAERMLSIVSDMKRLARDGGSDHGESDPIATVRSALNLITAEAATARLVTRYEPVPMIAASDARLGQVVLNLVMNALQSFAERQASNVIEVRVSTDPHGWALIEVSDNGAGIPPEVQRRMFDPFFTTKPPGVGTGLGLPLCQSFVRTLGGTLSFESEVGSGTVFRVRLPPAGHDATVETSTEESITRLTPVRSAG